MIGPIINNLSTLIVTVRRNVGSALLTTLLLLVLILAWSGKDVIVDAITGSKTAPLQTQGQIEDALRHDLKTINADRMLVRHFNVETDDQGLRQPWVSTLAVVTAPGIAQPGVPILRSSPRTFIRELVEQVKAEENAPVCVHMKVSEMQDSEYRAKLAEVGVYEQFICPVEDINRKTIGLIIASYLTGSKERPADEVVFETLRETGKRIGGYLPGQQTNWSIF